MLAEQVATPSESAPRKLLPRRDWILLPLLSVCTVVFLLVASELVTRYFWPAQEEDTCFANGRFRPNCTATVKVPEGQWSVDRYNECGYRSATNCQTKPAGAFRIVVMGSSGAHGLYIPSEETFAVKAAGALQKQSGRTVDVQNLGIPNTTPSQWYARLDEVLALHPDAVIFTVTPFDVEQTRTALSGSATPPLKPGVFKRIQHAVTQSRAVLMGQHLLFSNRDRFVRFYMLYGDKADFLRQPLTAAWQKRYADLDSIVARAADRLNAAHITFYLLAMPSRAEAALMNNPERPANTDPLSFGEQIAAIAARHGATYIDGVDALSHVSKPENFFYVVDGHIKPEGQSLIARKVGETIHVQ